MWWAEHAVMGAVFLCLGGYLSIRRNWIWLTAAALSQVPFWAGMGAFLIEGDSAPVVINAIFNVMVAGCFATIAERLQGKGKGGIVHIWLCVLFLLMCSLDVIQIIAPFDLYVIAQEALHYVALMVIGGRAYVKRIDGNHRNRLHSPDNGKSEDLA